MRRRDFITLLGGTAAAWPLAARAQQPAMPVIGYLSGRSAESDVAMLAAVRRGLNEIGYVEGRNLAIEYRFADGQSGPLPALLTELTRRPVAVIVVAGITAIDAELETWKSTQRKDLNSLGRSVVRTRFEKIKTGDTDFDRKMTIAARKGEAPTESDIDGLVDDWIDLQRLDGEDEPK